MTLPSDLPSALNLLAVLIHDDRLLFGLATVAVVLVVSGLVTAVLLKIGTRR